MRSQLSVAIVTKDRVSQLRSCLNSLVKQTTPLYQVLVIDDSEGGTARSQVAHFSKDLNLKYIAHDGHGVPDGRNQALTLSNTRYLGFIDDDCIASPSWAESGLQVLKQTSTAFVVGQTTLFNQGNLIALALQSRDDYWRKINIAQPQPSVARLVDTKNIIFDAEILKENQLRFDSHSQKEEFDSADFDMGLQIENSSLEGRFCQQMLVRHQETERLRPFLRKAYYRGYIAAYLHSKWQAADRWVDEAELSFSRWMKNTIKHFVSYYRHYTASLVLNRFQKILLVFLIRLYDKRYVDGYDAGKGVGGS